ncbi:unnamed protein product [Prunus brigantina]
MVFSGCGLFSATCMPSFCVWVICEARSRVLTRKFSLSTVYTSPKRQAEVCTTRATFLRYVVVVVVVVVLFFLLRLSIALSIQNPSSIICVPKWNPEKENKEEESAEAEEQKIRMDPW